MTLATGKQIIARGTILLCLLIVAAAAPLRAQDTEIRWVKDLAQASEMALKTNQPMMIDFWADWCGPCKVMDAEVYKNPALVAAFGEKMVGVRIHFDLQPDMVKKFNVPALPYLVFTNSYGTELMHQRGLIEASDLTAVVKAMPGDVTDFNRLDRILQEDKDDFKALAGMAAALRGSGFYDSSNTYFARALKQDAAKKDPAARESILFTIAQNSLELQDGKTAAKNLERCLKEFPRSAQRAEMLLGLGKAYSLDEKKDKAKKSLNSVIAEFPQSPAAQKAQVLLKSL
jgi:thiol-disulfide isomerase/thioredoxin